MVDAILAGLNEKQVEAVRTIEGPVLVLSGPGSGKTRCLTHRIAYLIAQGVRPEQILAVTFTNKAAGEIKERVAKLLKDPQRHSGGHPTLGTFHAIGARILRAQASRLGYTSTFTVLDTADQLALIRSALAEMELDQKRFTPESILAAIGKLKTDLLRPEAYHPREFFPQIVARVYERYQGALKQMNGMDFNDLIMLPVMLFERFPDVLQQYQDQWHYILVDEYQDTSHDQYRFISLLAAKRRNLFCIGDDAQSIYMFREADIRNILNFQKDYPQAKIVLLEQNYRSTKTILAAAQGVITNNTAQFPKELWTHNDAGAHVTLYEAINERDEAGFVATEVVTLAEGRGGLSDIAVLYRTHAQSRALEEALMHHGVPYRIAGGIKFYERREIKDLLAYLRVIRNPQDLVSFGRIANVPSRGIGEVTLAKLANIGADTTTSLRTLAATKVHTQQSKTLASFADLIENLRVYAQEHTLSATLKHIVASIDYEEYLRGLHIKDFESGDERIENVKELLTVAAKHDPLGPGSIDRFLEEVALMQDVDTLERGSNAVTLMTMHASKGLEFPVVFIIGVEEGLFPHSRTLYAPKELEEERRLCYVALTRAKERVYLSYARYRHIFGSMQANLPSRFIGEIPQELVEHRWREPFADTADDEDTITYT